MKTVNILGVPIAAVNMDQAIAEIEQCIRNEQKAYVTVTGVHGIMESQDDEEVKRIHQAAGMCVPDGMPTVWIGKLYGYKNIRQVCGRELMLEVMRRSQTKGYTHFFYGGKEGVPALLRQCLCARFPGVKVVGLFSPPFRPMSRKEENELQDLVDELSPDIIWVGLSTPKQEMWMAAHVGKLNTRVMIGVGAAFDFHAGLIRQAPRWMQQAGLEWLFRLCMEPKRLWKRYLKNNPRFIIKVLGQMLSFRKGH